MNNQILMLCNIITFLKYSNKLDSILSFYQMKFRIKNTIFALT